MATSDEQPISEQPAKAETPAANGREAEGADLDLIELFNNTVSENDATFVVYYRGDW